MGLPPDPLMDKVNWAPNKHSGFKSLLIRGHCALTCLLVKMIIHFSINVYVTHTALAHKIAEQFSISRWIITCQAFEIRVNHTFGIIKISTVNTNCVCS